MKNHANQFNTPKTSEFPVSLSEQSTPVFQGVEGKGWFVAARLTIITKNPPKIDQVRFSLKIDDNLVFYGILTWYLGSMGNINPFGVVVTINDHFEPGKSIISIAMGLPFPLQYYRNVKVALTSPHPNQNSIESASLQLMASQGYKFTAYNLSAPVSIGQNCRN